jgi:hypothetical protein
VNSKIKLLQLKNIYSDCRMHVLVVVNLLACGEHCLELTFPVGTIHMTWNLGTASPWFVPEILAKILKGGKLPQWE